MTYRCVFKFSDTNWANGSATLTGQNKETNRIYSLLFKTENTWTVCKLLPRLFCQIVNSYFNSKLNYELHVCFSAYMFLVQCISNCVQYKSAMESLKSI